MHPNKRYSGLSGRHGATWTQQRRAGRLIGVLVLAVLLPFASACEFEATDPTRLTEEDIQGEAMLNALVVGAITSYDGAFDRLSMITALLSDEAIASGSWNGWHMADKEGIINLFDSESDHINIPWIMWRWLARARAVADETYGFLQEQAQNPSADPRVAMMRLYSGLAITDFADNFCQAAYDGGPVVEPEESYRMAIDRLNEAIAVAQAAGVDSIIHRAHLVLARAYMGLGDLDEARNHARQVPDGLVWYAHFRDAPGERSFFWGHNADRGELSIGPRFRDTGDPRVPVENQGRTGPDTETIVWVQKKYPTRNDNWIIANWQEARLIEAEVLLNEGNVDAAISLMNQNRAAAGLGPLPMGLSLEEGWEHLRRERAYELFLQARRFNDMRRWGEFPEGWGATCIPISREEKDSNPNLRNVHLKGWPS